MKTNNVYTILRFVMFAGALLGHEFKSLQASDTKSSAKDTTYETYFAQQEKIYKDLTDLKIPGVRPLNISAALADEIIAHSPNTIQDAMTEIEQGAFDDHTKNIILHGMSGTGKTCLAQAMAIKTQTPCIFVNTGTISTEYMNSGVQNLQKIFEYAQKLEKRLNKPCIIIFDELETLTKKHANKTNHENNILISFWLELDKLSNSRVVVIGTMNNTEDLPVQITNRTSMIKIPLPNRKHRATILSHYLKAQQDKHKIDYSRWVSISRLARKTNGYSNRDLQNLVSQATRKAKLAPSIPGMPVMRNKVTRHRDFMTARKEINKDPQRRLEREIGTWRHWFKNNLRDSKVALPAIALTTSIIFAYNSITNQREGLAMQRNGLSMQNKGLGLQEEAMSTRHMAKQAAMNTSVMGIPVGLMCYLANPFNVTH